MNFRAHFFGNFMETFFFIINVTLPKHFQLTLTGLKFEPVLGGSFVFIRTHVSGFFFFFFSF